MAFVIDTFAIYDQEDLGRLMVNPKCLGNSIGNGPVADEIEIIEVDLLRLVSALQTVFDDRANGAACAVLKDHLRAAG